MRVLMMKLFRVQSEKKEHNILPCVVHLTRNRRYDVFPQQIKDKLIMETVKYSICVKIFLQHNVVRYDQS